MTTGQCHRSRPSWLRRSRGPIRQNAKLQFKLLDADTLTSTTPFDLSAGTTNNPYPALLEFGTLGTYKLNLTVGATKSNTPYTDTATYTFHVGPIADLEVRDAGASPEAGGSQRPYTVMAVNNGPEPVVPAVEVTLSGVPQGAQVVPSEGDYDSATGVWTIGDLSTPDVRRSTGLPEGPTLSLVTAVPNPPDITAAIEAQDYCVRIKTGATASENDLDCAGSLPTGYTEHTAAYYDHDEGNNTVTVQARAGTASEAGAAGAPRSLRVQRYGPISILWWAWMDTVNGFRVTHFQVQRNGIMVASDVTENQYVDLLGDVNQSYRVRAVNEFGVAGPWSSHAGAEPESGFGDLSPPRNLTAAPAHGEGRIELRWNAPLNGGEVLYRIDHADNGAGPWRVLAGSQADTSYAHDGLAPETTHYYRVAAVRDTLISAWVYVLEATQPEIDYGDSPVHTVPSEPRNLRFSSLDRTAVTLAWDPPADDGGTRVTGYEYWVIGPCATSDYCDVVPPTRVSGTSRAISGLTHEGTYDFQVRAFNAVGAGPWSQGIVKTVGAEPPVAGGGRVVFQPLAGDGARGRLGHLPGEADQLADPALVGGDGLGRRLRHR